MANEITVTIQLDVVKSPISDQIRKSNLRFDLATAVKSGGIQVVGTTAEAIGISADVATKGWAYFRNVDSTNYVVLSTASDGTTPFAKLMPGELALIPLGSGTIYGMANTAAVNLEYQVYAR